MKNYFTLSNYYETQFDLETCSYTGATRLIDLLQVI